MLFSIANRPLYRPFSLEVSWNVEADNRISCFRDFFSVRSAKEFKKLTQDFPTLSYLDERFIYILSSGIFHRIFH